MIPRFRQQSSDDATFDLHRLVGVSVTGSDAFTSEMNGVLALFLPECKRFELSLRRLEDTDSAEGPVLRVVEDGSVTHEEGYELGIDENGVELRANGVRGAFYGTRSLLVALGSAEKLALGTVVDQPRFGWRGVHLDVARHYFPVEFIKRFIDLLSIHKLNVFHWHLTEDQGWRVQIDAYPKLAEIAAFRQGASGRYGGSYSKDEIREVVAYAAARFVTVVPEIEMPGHAVAALAAYPEFSCTGGPFAVETEWGIFEDVFCVGRDATLAFLERVVDEVIELFPSKYFHIGGDECPKARWKTCPACQARMRAEGLADEHHLQSWFVTRMSRYLESRGKRLVGWDEILEGGLAPGATVMSWRGTSGGIRAAQMGHDVIMSPTSHCYLDYKQAPSEDEPGAWFAPAVDLATVYGYEPTPTELTEAEAAHVLGVQANIWTERMPSAEHVEYMAFPRLCALAEVAWSGAERDLPDFLGRLGVHRRLLDRLEVAYHGSAFPRPLGPSAEERAQYRRALAERSAGQVATAY